MNAFKMGMTIEEAAETSGIGRNTIENNTAGQLPALRAYIHFDSETPCKILGLAGCLDYSVIRLSKSARYWSFRASSIGV